MTRLISVFCYIDDTAVNAFLQLIDVRCFRATCKGARDLVHNTLKRIRIHSYLPLMAQAVSGVATRYISESLRTLALLQRVEECQFSAPGSSILLHRSASLQGIASALPRIKTLCLGTEMSSPFAPLLAETVAALTQLQKLELGSFSIRGQLKLPASLTYLFVQDCKCDQDQTQQQEMVIDISRLRKFHTLVVRHCEMTRLIHSSRQRQWILQIMHCPIWRDVSLQGAGRSQLTSFELLGDVSPTLDFSSLFSMHMDALSLNNVRSSTPSASLYLNHNLRLLELARCPGYFGTLNLSPFLGLQEVRLVDLSINELVLGQLGLKHLYVQRVPGVKHIDLSGCMESLAGLNVDDPSVIPGALQALQTLWGGQGEWLSR